MKRLIKDDDITCGLSHLYVCAGAWTRQEVVSEKLADMREKAHGRDIALEAAKRATWRIHKNRRHTHLRFKNQARLPSDGAPSFVTAFIRLFARRTDGTSTASCSDPAVHSIALGYSNSSRKDESPSVRAAPTTRARRRSPRDGFRACAVCHSIARGSPDADFGLRSGTCHVIQHQTTPLRRRGPVHSYSSLLSAKKFWAAQFHVETGPTVSTCFHTAFNIMGGGDGEGKSKREVNPVSEMENWKVR